MIGTHYNWVTADPGDTVRVQRVGWDDSDANPKNHTTRTLDINVPSGDAPRRTIMPQAYKDQSADHRKGLKSLFATGKRGVEKDAYQQAHLSASGLPGVVKLAVMDPNNQPIPYAPFEWGGRQYMTDSDGVFKLVEKNYFENAISAENERMKYTTQMISLVVGQPAENVIALFGYNFYVALAADKASFATELYKSYMQQSGLNPQIIERKAAVFSRYANADASPEVMCNFGDNDPEWSKAFNKLSMLIEYHPSAILFDEGPPNPLRSDGLLRGDTGANNHGDLDSGTYDLARNNQRNKRLIGHDSSMLNAAGMAIARNPPAPAPMADTAPG